MIIAYSLIVNQTTNNPSLTTKQIKIMRKKESWMFKGAIVLALGKKANIVKMQENELDGVDYVYYITCKVEGEKHTGRYHPSDVQEIVVKSV